MIDIDAIKARLAAVHTAGVHDITMRLADGRLCVFVRMRDWNCNTAHEADEAVTTLLGHAPADLTALIAEVERLRGEAERERAAVVAWLQAASQRWAVDDPLNEAADAIERGEHRHEENE